MASEYPRFAELVRVVELGAPHLRYAGTGMVVNVYKDLERKRTFFPVVFQRRLCRVRPSFVSTFADEELDLVDPAFKLARFARSSTREVIDSVMKGVRGSFKSAAGQEGSRPRLVELMRTVALGPYDCPGEAPWYFTVKIYKDLEKRKTFFPIVFRREFYRIKPRFAKKLVNEQVDFVVHDFDDGRFTRASEGAALTGIVRHIRNSFEPAYRRRGRRA